jgi:hypothetical protein
MYQPVLPQTTFESPLALLLNFTLLKLFVKCYEEKKFVPLILELILEFGKG